MSDNSGAEIENRPYKKVTETSSEYQDHLESLDYFRNPLKNCFGAEALATIQFSDRKIQDSQGQQDLINFHQQQKERVVKDIRTSLFAKWANPHHRPHIYRLVQEGCNDPRMNRDLLNIPPGQDEDLNREDFLNTSRIPDELLLGWVQTHVDLFLQSSEGFDQRVETYKKQFQESIQPLVEDGTYKIDPQTLERRFGETTVVLGDALLSDSPEKHLGMFQSTTSVVTIMQQAGLDKEEATFSHEMFHALAGRMISFTRRFPNGHLGESYFINLDSVRSGLSFSGDRHTALGWVDEAVTETLTCQHHPDQGVYTEERELLDQLMIGGALDLSLFMDAYFENYDPEVAEELRVPAWKRLQDTINREYSPGFLARLDRYVKKHGLTATINQFLEDIDVIDKEGKREEEPTS